jgi:hypothetical protein
VNISLLPLLFTCHTRILLISWSTGRSIVFAVAYGLLLPAFALRLLNPSSRCVVLLRPAAFVLARIPTFAIRANMSEGHYNPGLFIAEQVRLSLRSSLPDPAAVDSADHITTDFAPLWICCTLWSLG